MRAILVGIVAVFAIFAAYPNLFSVEEREASDLISDAALTLGLDLQGGVHWLLRIDDDTAIQQELASTRTALEQTFEDRKIVYTDIKVIEDHIAITGADSATVTALLESDYETLRVDSSGGQMKVDLGEDRRAYIIDRGVQQSLEVLRTRIDDLGIREPILAPQGEGRVLVQMAGDIDPKRAREIISQTTFLEFKLVLDAAPNEELLLARHPGGLPEDSVVVRSESPPEFLLVPKDPVLTGDKLEDARVGFDRRNRPIVLFTWDREGGRIFREFTGENVGNRLAAIIDKVAVTAPNINSRIGRSGQIEGNFTQEEAADLVVALRSGALPIPLIIEEERSVGPSLGADSIRQGLTSLLIGGAGVVLFMIVYYSVSGLLANVALALNIILIIGLMSAFQATLTLPGIAGLVLTIGMAVDANVIIFERIREEMRGGGKSVRNAVQAGFNRSRLTILDANITTVIAAIVLLYFGRGPVQGFGVTLAIGIFSSVFCALVVTRLLVELWLSRSGEKLRI